MPGSAPTTYGNGADAVVGGDHDAGVADQPLLDGLGLQALERQLHVRFTADLDLEALALRAEIPGGVEVLLTHEPVDARGDDRRPVDEGAPVELARRDLARLDDADGRLDRLGGDGDLLHRLELGIDVEPHLRHDHPYRGLEARGQQVDDRARHRLLGRHAEPHDVAHHVGGVVGADVAELLRPHVRDRRGQRRDHQREPLGDAARVNTGAVQRASAFGAGIEDGRAIGEVGVDPPDGGDDVLARAQQRHHFVLVRQQRAVDHAVGVEGEDVVHAGRREDADGVQADEFADVLAVLALRVHPGADQLEVGMRQHALDRGLAHAARRPLHHSDRHATHSSRR